MNIHDERWIRFQIENYENALRIAIKKGNKEKIEEYSKELKNLKEKLKRNE